MKRAVLSPDGATAATIEDLVAILLPLPRARVTVPDAARVEVEPVGGLTILRVHVHPDDVGRVVGKNGHSIKRMRAVAESMATSLGARVFVDVANSRRGRSDPSGERPAPAGLSDRRQGP